VSSAVTWSQGLPTSCNEMVLGYSAIWTWMNGCKDG
jgi:hypothetical protein